MKPGKLVRIVVAGMGGAQETTRLIDDLNGRTVVVPLAHHHEAWLQGGKRQAQWKRERAPIGKGGRR
jgi:hypothetical protein